VRDGEDGLSGLFGLSGLSGTSGVRMARLEETLEETRSEASYVALNSTSANFLFPTFNRRA